MNTGGSERKKSDDCLYSRSQKNTKISFSLKLEMYYGSNSGSPNETSMQLEVSGSVGKFDGKLGGRYLNPLLFPGFHCTLCISEPF